LDEKRPSALHGKERFTNRWRAINDWLRLKDFEACCPSAAPPVGFHPHFIITL
jgi:hypothetical protein